MKVKPRNSYIVFMLMFTGNLLFADDSVCVRIFTTKIIKTFIFSPSEGSYHLYGDGKLIADCDASGVFQLSIEQDSIHVKTFESDKGKYTVIKIVAKEISSAFKIKSVEPLSTVRMYDDQLLVTLSADKLQLLLINTVGLESYISGVVQSESGKGNNAEYYKLQAILCRTYLLAHLNRHVAEGYEVCDDVHCQAYLSRASEKNIMYAVVSTKGLVIVDNNLNLITAAFHSNCGGQTCNSEDVWAISTTYLKTVNDPFCAQKVHSSWEHIITYSEWKNYLKSKGKMDTDSSNVKTFETSIIHQASSRSINYVDGNIMIPFKTIRTDFKLKSAFFSIEQRGNNIVFKGRGYGHGVGLCQEGAMEMSKQKYSYQDMLHYYYKDVSVVDLRALNYFKQE